MKGNRFSLLGFFMPLLSLAQLRPLHPGDTLPDISVPETINYKTDALRLADLQGKAVILDFWSPNCIGCLEKFPDMEALQQQFQDSLYVILVNAQSRDSTLRFFARRKKIRMPAAILITGDTLLAGLFPHDGVPFHVWIDKEGIVRHLADAYNATPEKVAAFIAGEKKPFEAYHPRQQYLSSLFDARWEDKLAYYSYLSKAIRGIQPGSGLNEAYAHLNVVNASAVELFQSAYSEETRYDFTRPGCLILHLADRFPYERPRNNNDFDRWFETYCYNYALQLPKERKAQLYRIMQEDLRRYFHLNAAVRKREMPCWVLVRTSAENKVRSTSPMAKENFRQDNIREPVLDAVRYLYRQPFETFSQRLGAWIERGLKRPFIDATGLSGLVDIRMSGAVIDNIDRAHLAQLRRELQHYGLDLVAQSRPIDVLEISDTK